MAEPKIYPSRIKTVSYSILRTILRILDNFIHDSCLIRASGLAFNTLLALVPLSAVLFAFGGFNNVGTELQSFLMEVLLPESLNQILEALTQFTENSSRLGTYGIIFFLITILMLMNNIENNLNAIWHCPRKRGFFQQLTVYTTVIVLAALLIGGNFSLSGDLLAIIPDYTEAISEPFLLKTLYLLSSILFITLTFMLLILLIPSTKVSFISALTGALTGAIIWELAKWGFKTWANNSVRNSVIYGSLFLIPLLLIWLYVVWLIIMITMETAFVHQHRFEKHSRYLIEEKAGQIFSLNRDLYLSICDVYSKGDSKASTELLAKRLNRSEEEITRSINRLINEDLIARSDEGWFFPLLPPEKMSLSQLYTTLSGISATSEESLILFREGGEKELEGKKVSDLLNDK